jgi:hypothetical protein
LFFVCFSSEICQLKCWPCLNSKLTMEKEWGRRSNERETKKKRVMKVGMIERVREREREIHRKKKKKKVKERC